MKSIAGYNVTKLIAKGGMAAIYLAEQQSLQRQVVLKFLNPKLDDAVKKQFINEGRIIASLKHPNIITVFDVVSSDKHNFLAMEYLPDGDLETRLHNKLDTYTVLNIISKISDALHLIHKQGIIHGDIKPANILFRGNDCPLLTDFGISHRIEPKKEVDMSSGDLYASPSYASPELIQGKPFDYRTDLYSLGIMLYEMLSGEKPFAGETEIETIANSIQKPVPKLAKPLQELQPLLESLLAKAPENRLSDAKLVTRFVAQYLKDHPQLTSSSETKLIDTDVVVEYIARSKQTKNKKNKTRYMSISILVLILFAVLWFNKQALWHNYIVTPESTASRASTLSTAVNQQNNVSVTTDDLALNLSQTKQDLAEQNDLLQQKNNELAQIKKQLEQQKERARQQQLKRKRTINGLIKKGKSALKNYNLTTPLNNNAYYYFQKVLQLDSRNLAAKQGIEDVVNRYEMLAKSELDKYHYQKAQSFITSGLNIDPNNKSLLLLKTEANLQNEPKRVINKVKDFFNNL